MEKLKITDVVKHFNISTRTLRYYEQIGLIESIKSDDYAYRLYNENAILRLRQIIILRKLRIPLKQIYTILESENAVEIIETFRQNLNEIDDEITALSTIRFVLEKFISRLRENINFDIKIGLFDDISILDIVDSLTITKIPFKFKEEKTMEDLKTASDQLNKITDKDVRIIYLPPSALASAYTLGDNAENDTDIIMGNFVKHVDLFKINPGVRFYGFNNPVFEGDKFIKHGYEVWATIPDDFDVPAPLTKKYFDGGLYAAYTSKPVSFEDWKHFYDWIIDNDDFEYDARGDFADVEPPKKGYRIACSGWGRLEEHLNSYNIYGLNKKHTITHIDFLMPIKEKKMRK